MMKRYLPRLAAAAAVVAVALAASGPPPAVAQQPPPPAVAQQPPPPAAAKNLLGNGGFETVKPDDNLWDGVDAEGFIAAEKGSATALRDQGGLGEVPMAVSVSAADLNGDGLTDLFLADPLGYFRVFFNGGSAKEPKFTNCEVVPLFLSRESEWTARARFGTKATLCDWGRSGKLDLIVGNYAGEIFYIPNAGSAMVPEFRQPAKIDATEIKTTANPEPWGNLFAPAAADWNRDGRMDLLLGEGSYSANAIHLLLCKSASTPPKFTDQDRSYLAYGDGREQLIPAVVDFNGDGILDLLVGDRLGAVSVHLGTANWKVGTEVKQASLLSFGSATSVGSPVAPATADMNGDGLFDVLLGKSNGRVALALNQGTKEQPKFKAATDLKGVGLWDKQVFLPEGWSFNVGRERGNFYAYASAIAADSDPAAEPPEGKRCLKVSYCPPPHKVMRMVLHDLPAAAEPGDEGMLWQNDRTVEVHLRGVNWYGHRSTTKRSFFSFTVEGPPPPGTPLEISMKYKGAGFKGRWRAVYAGCGKRAQDKIERLDRGAKITEDEAFEELVEEGPLAPSPMWKQSGRTVTFRFKTARELNDPATWKGVGKPFYFLALVFDLEVNPFDGAFYLDAVSITPRG